MSSFTYTNYPTYGQKLSDQAHYSQAVRLPTSPPTIKASGQGGWDPKTGTISSSFREEIDQAFANVATALEAAGSKGWNDVYLVRIYYVTDDEREGKERKRGLEGAAGEALRKWSPGHRPVLTAVEVRGLALEGMRVEVEVEAVVEG